jgi:hypothetical protein
MDTSCAWFHTDFGSSYPPDNSIVFRDWKFTNLEGRSYTPNDGVVGQPVRGKMAWTKAKLSSASNDSKLAPFYFPEGNAAGVNVYV